MNFETRLVQFQLNFFKNCCNASYEELSLGIDISEVAPFWRVVDPDSKLAKKLNCGINLSLTKGLMKV